jgi:hypothetical protein
MGRRKGYFFVDTANKTCQFSYNVFVVVSTISMVHQKRMTMSIPYIAEVIESSTTTFAAQTLELHGAPPFGSFVKVSDSITVIAIIYEISTGSTELNRRPVAYGKTEEELKLEQPQIFELLRTEFKALIVGYADESGMKQVIPPQPPKLHHFVYACTPGEIQEFTSKLEYFRTLVGVGGTLTDELLIAAIQQTCRTRGNTARDAFIQAGKELARLFRDDYDRLESILRRVTLG